MVSAGNSDVKQVIIKGRQYIKRLNQLEVEILNPKIRSQIANLKSISSQIFDFAESYPEKIQKLGRFNDYYLPTSLKFLENYATLSQKEVQGENIQSALAKISQGLNNFETAFEHMLDNLYADKVMDLDGDMAVLQNMMVSEGLEVSKEPPKAEKSEPKSKPLKTSNNFEDTKVSENTKGLKSSKSIKNTKSYRNKEGAFDQYEKTYPRIIPLNKEELNEHEKKHTDKYITAAKFFREGNYSEAYMLFKQLGDFQDAPTQAQNADRLRKELRNRKVKKVLLAIFCVVLLVVLLSVGFRYISGSIRSDNLAPVRSQIEPFSKMISAGSFAHALNDEGNVVSSQRWSFVPARTWQNIVAISENYPHIVGLVADGTVVANGRLMTDHGQLDVDDWRDIVAISTNTHHTVGLRANGTVVAVGLDSLGRLNVDEWQDVVAISTGQDHTIGLKTNGTVVATGSNVSGQLNVSRWRNIVAISANSDHTIGLRSDGTVLTVGANRNGQLNTNRWRNIVAISTSALHTVGLRMDGTVVAVGNNERGQLNVSSWSDIVAISAGFQFTMGLRSDGTVVTTDPNRIDTNDWQLFNH